MWLMSSDIMGLMKINISKLVLWGLEDYKDYWIEPEAPKDLKIISKMFFPDKEYYEVIYFSSTFPELVEGSEIPQVNLIIHRGKKPTTPFIFR
jgi:hypothetical protein